MPVLMLTAGDSVFIEYVCVASAIGGLQLTANAVAAKRIADRLKNLSVIRN